MNAPVHEFELPNVAAGPDPFRLSTVAGDESVDAVVLLFQRDYHCSKCRSQVQDVAARHDEFEAAGEAYDQPTRFGALGSLHDLVGRMPKAVVFDARSGTPEVAAVHEGPMPADRPDVDEFLAAVRSPGGAAL
ncbi:peroxiredoxin [Halobacteriales archaeon QH_10_70_21]|nr:MAG: peroxiredoxin [Halobacteriales archaeon QH_10_70_21]